jgi:hypothetical protein
MPRFRPRLLLTALALGAATTLAIAWPLSIALPELDIAWLRPHRPRYSTEENVVLRKMTEGVPILCESRARLLHERITLKIYGVPSGFRELPPTAMPPPSWAARPVLEDGSHCPSVKTEAHGWPMRAMAAEAWDYGRFLEYRQCRAWLRGSQEPIVLIPTRPIWLGLLVDSFLYTIAWYGALIIPRAIRRSLRHHRNQCPHCAYDLRATPPPPPCPECGKRH